MDGHLMRGKFGLIDEWMDGWMGEDRKGKETRNQGDKTDIPGSQ